MKYAEDTWNWIKGVGYITDDGNVYDGGHVEHNCTDINKAQYSYNAAVLIQGLAFLYNYVSRLRSLGSHPLFSISTVLEVDSSTPSIVAHGR